MAHAPPSPIHQMRPTRTGSPPPRSSSSTSGPRRHIQTSLVVFAAQRHRGGNHPSSVLMFPVASVKQFPVVTCGVRGLCPATSCPARFASSYARLHSPVIACHASNFHMPDPPPSRTSSCRDIGSIHLRDPASSRPRRRWRYAGEFSRCLLPGVCDVEVRICLAAFVLPLNLA